ncbi:MAG: RNA polymerase sporulation sigma factor SigK [Clostridia bacterium]|nr:RNA polymerase sporulation sigma factor SigK [Clostridia bacterium]
MLSVGNLIRMYLLKLLGLRQNGMDLLMYMNGASILPEPLTKEEEESIYREIAAGNEDAKNELITRNLRLVIYIARKFENANVSTEDLVSIGTIGLIKSVRTFDPDKNIKLATYASRCIENEILMYLRKTANTKTDISLDEPLNVDWDGNELLLSDILYTDDDMVFSGVEANEEIRYLQKCIDKLNERDRTIVTLRFGLNDTKEHTQKEVADRLGISQSYISRIEKRIMEDLKNQLKSINS